MGSHSQPHMCVDSSIHSESAVAGRQAASQRRTGRTLMRAEGDQEEKPTEAQADIWRCMTEPGRVRPSRPSRCLPGRLCPLSASGVEHDNTEEPLRRVTAPTAPRLPLKLSDRDTVAQVQRVQSTSHTHTRTALLAPSNTLIGISNVPPSTCPSLLQWAIHTMQELLLFPFPSFIFSLSLSVSPAVSLRLCRVPALYCSSLPFPSPPLHLSPCVPERRKRRRRGGNGYNGWW